MLTLHVCFLKKNIKLYRNIISPVVNGCESWSLTLEKEHWLRIFVYMLVRGYKKIFFIIYISLYIIRLMEPMKKRRSGHVARMGKKTNAYNVLVGKTEGKGPFGKGAAKSGLGSW
jgi:hypothetical protein